MADVQRWRAGAPHKRNFDVDAAQEIEIGDLVYSADYDPATQGSGDDIRPADQLSYVGLSQSQENFVNSFAGVAAQKHRASTDTNDVVVNTRGVHEFICASATWEVGDLVGVDDNAGGTALENQTVISVTDASRAIGRCAKREATAVTKVLVDIVGTVSHGGPQQGQASA